MTTLRNSKISTILLLMLSTVLMATCFAFSAFAANFPLEIINIKPAGTGNPAIPATNRIFRAYPGIEYNIRAAVIGGKYPYVYSLSNAPSGMTINAATGTIRWPNPQSSASNIRLSVTDTENTTASTTWSITVSTGGFIFVNSAYSGTETGSIPQPYRSLTNLLNNKSTTTDIVYFRSGTYQSVDFNSTADYTMNLDKSPRTWLAYPEETVTLQGGSANSTQAHKIVILGGTFYFDGLTIKDSVNYGILTQGSFNYKTIRRCIFNGLIPSDSINNNYGFVHTGNDGPGYYFVIQDSEFKNWRNASAIGSLYNDKKMLIENNYIHSDLPSGSPSGISSTNGISPKYYTDYLTVRGNKVVMRGDYPMGGLNAGFVDADNIEILFNVFHKTSGRGGHLFDFEVGHQRRTYYWRNTLIGDIGARSVSGPYTIANNVISNPSAPWLGSQGIYQFISNGNASYFTITNNLTNTTSSNIVDVYNNYKLVPSQSQYVGTRGWQFSDGSTPMDGVFIPPQSPQSPQSPQGLKIISEQ